MVELADFWTVIEAGFQAIPEAVAIVSDGGRLIYSAHRLYYVARKLVQRYTTERLTAKYFEHTIIPEYEKAHRPLPGMYREPRGSNERLDELRLVEQARVVDERADRPVAVGDRRYGPCRVAVRQLVRVPLNTDVRLPVREPEDEVDGGIVQRAPEALLRLRR